MNHTKSKRATQPKSPKLVIRPQSLLDLPAPRRLNERERVEAEVILDRLDQSGLLVFNHDRPDVGPVLAALAAECGVVLSVLMTRCDVEIEGGDDE